MRVWLVAPRNRVKREWTIWLMVALVWTAVILAISLVILLAPVYAGKGFDPNSPTAKWFNGLERPYCAPGVVHCFCCGISDAYPINILADATPNGDEPDGLAEITDGSAITFPNGQKRRPVMNGTRFHFAGKDVVSLKAGNPTGTAWVFMWPADEATVGWIWCVVPLPPSM